MKVSENWYADQNRDQEEQTAHRSFSQDSEKEEDGGAMMIGQGANRDENFKTQRSYESEYAQLAMQGGRKDLLCIEGQDADRSSLRRKNEAQSTPVKDNTPVKESEYVKLAKQGGQRDLLCIEENEKKSQRVEYKSSSGDWYKHDLNAETSTNGHCNKITGKHFESPSKPVNNHATPERQTTQRSNNNSSGFFIGGTPSGGPEQEVKFGKKRFNQSDKREAPFATQF